MADQDDQRLKILIQFGLDDAAAQKAIEQMDMLKGSTSETAKSSSDLTDATKDLGEEQEKASDMTELLHHNHRALHQIMHMIGHETSPMLGHALTGAMYGPIGGVIALGAAFEWLHVKIDDWHKKLDEAGKAAAEGSFATGIAAMNTALEEGRSKAEAYAIAVGNIAKGEVTIAQALASQLAYMQVISKERAAEEKAAEEAAKSKKEFNQQAGNIPKSYDTPEQMAVQKAENEIAAAKAEAAAKKKDREDELTAKELALHEANEGQPALDAARLKTGDVAAKEKAHRDSLEKDFGDEAYKTKMATLIEAKDKADALFQKVREGKASASEQGAVSRMVDDGTLEKIFAHIALLQRGRNQFEATQTPEARGRFQVDAAAAEEAEKKARANVEEIDKLRRELADTKREQAVTNPLIDKELADKIQDILNKAATGLLSQPHGAEINQGGKVADILEGGGTISKTQGAFLLALDKTLGGNATTWKEAADHLESFKHNSDQFFNGVKSMADYASSNNVKLRQQIARIDTLSAQLAGGGAKTTP